jgi:hypothetical protein
MLLHSASTTTVPAVIEIINSEYEAVPQQVAVWFPREAPVRSVPAEDWAGLRRMSG